MSNNTIHKLVIIGSGPAGLASGIYAARANLKPLIIDGPAPGGQLMGTTYVENWPGEKSILGPQLMQNMRAHAEHFGCTFLSGSATEINLSQRPFTLSINNETIIKSHALIIASGATPKRLNVPGEETYWGKGVTTCAVCDGAFYPDKNVIIVGGGDTAMEDASFMTKFTNKITIVQNMSKLTASVSMQKRILDNEKITIIYNSTITEIKGNDSHATHALVKNLETNETKTLEADGIFVAIGLTPNTAIFRDQLQLDNYGYIIPQNHTHTSIPGVFVAGDVADYRYRQAITSAGSGCMAALDAERYLSNIL